MRFTKDHEWVNLAEDGVAAIGITKYAADQLGDVVFVEVPQVGRSVSQGDAFAVVESVKAASDVYAPVTGEVVARNESLDATPELVNSDPYGGGWLFEVVPSDRAQLDDLMDAAAYAESLDS